MQVRDVQFLRAATDRTIKMTVPGPFTMAQQAQNEHYEREEDLAFAFADVVREEIAELFAAGADIVQLDEPWMEARPDAARRYGLETLQRALDGVQGTKVLHICFGYPLFVPDHPSGYQFLTELAEAPGRPDLDRDRAVEPRRLGAVGAGRQDRDPRRDRARHAGGRDAGARGRAHRAARCRTSRSSSSSQRPTAG